MEAPAVLGRSDVQRAKEHPANRLRCAESATRRDGGDAVVRLLEQPTRHFDASRLDVATGGDADFVLEATREVAFAHPGASRHCRDREIRVRMVGDPLLDVAQAVARRFVMFLRRPANQSQFSAVLQAQAAQHDGIRAVQHHVAEHPDADCSVAALARVALMSERSFARCFTAETGVTPARYVERVRVETARRLLEDTDDGVEAIATAAGFGTAETMRRTFLRLVRTSPTEYRRRFRAA